MNGIAGIPHLHGDMHEQLVRFWGSGQGEEIRLERFAHWLRDQSFMFDACDPNRTAAELFERNFDTALAIGARSIPMGIAAAMHIYMLSAIATYRIPGELEPRRRSFFENVVKNRWLIANSGGAVDARASQAGHLPATAEMQSGKLLVAGHKKFVSLGTVADLLIFTASEKSSGAPLSLFAPLRDSGVKILPSPFASFLADTGTCSVRFDGLTLTLDHVISGGVNAVFEEAHAFQRMWFSALIPAVYLGAAVAALEEARAVALTDRVDDRPLASLDGVTVEFGRLALSIASCFLQVASVKQAVAGACNAAATDVERICAVDQAATFKYSCMRTVCAVASGIRALVGIRSMAPASRLLRFLQESMVGPMHPEIEPLLERRLGRAYLQS